MTYGKAFSPVITSEDWMSEAACIKGSADPKIFDTVDETNPVNPEFPYIKQALAYCERCSVRNQCLLYAMRNMRGYTGIVGGAKFVNGRVKGK
jgi:hypothetical protein